MRDKKEYKENRGTEMGEASKGRERGREMKYSKKKIAYEMKVRIREEIRRDGGK